MKQITIIDNFLDREYFKSLQELLLGPYFPWYYNNGVIYDVEDGNLNNYQFTHCFYTRFTQQSDFYNNLGQLIQKINPCSLMRIKANLLPKNEKIIEHGFHIDIPYLKKDQNSTTAVFYVNTNNGYTKFDDGTVVESIENRIVIFDSKISHTGSTCTDKKSRVVINFNYF